MKKISQALEASLAIEFFVLIICSFIIIIFPRKLSFSNNQLVCIKKKIKPILMNII